MLTEKLIQEIIDYLDGKLDKKAQKELRSQLDRLGYDLNELGDLQNLQEKISHMPADYPRDEMSDAFYRQLDANQKLNVKKWWNRLGITLRAPQFAYAVLLILFGWIGGYLMHGDRSSVDELSLLTAEVRQMKLMVSLSLIQNPSPVERLRAVNNLSAAQQGSQEVMDALIRSLNTDRNTNVRLAAIDALRSNIDQPYVRQALVQSLSVQKSPLVQLALAELLVSVGEKAARRPLEMILLRDDLNIFLRRGLERKLNKLI